VEGHDERDAQATPRGTRARRRARDRDEATAVLAEDFARAGDLESAHDALGDAIALAQELGLEGAGVAEL